MLLDGGETLNGREVAEVPVEVGCIDGRDFEFGVIKGVGVTAGW